MSDSTRPLAASAAALALLGGVLTVQWLPVLPSLWWTVAGLLPAALMVCVVRRWYWLLFALFGVGWAVYQGTAGMDARLPRQLEGGDFQVVGTVVDLPDSRVDAARFLLNVERATRNGRRIPLRGKITVSWYDARMVPAPCSRWHLLLRLKRPRGLLNPGGADSERSALERGIHATGYVRNDPGNRLIGTHWCVDGVRAAIADAIAARVSDPQDAALLRALAVGDTRGLQPRDWEVARANGVSHLIAISGFHVGMAAVFGVTLVWFIYLLWPACALHLPRPQVQAAAAFAVAAVYSALAGFGLPTVRTLLMIAVVAMAQCSRRGTRGAHSLALALLLILLVDPLAVLSAGFWLSFVGVAFLMLCLQARGPGIRGFVYELSAGQFLMTVSLLPLTLWFFGQASLVGALSNLIAVPFVSFVIVPCALLATLLLGVCPPLAAPAWWLAAHLMHAQWWLLQALASWPGAHWYLPGVHVGALCLALVGALWMFLPRGIPQRWLGALLFLPLLMPPQGFPRDGGFQAWVLDVGQGLSVVVRTHQHVLVYDAGARYPSGFDLGEAVVVPSLHALGLNQVDMLMISHADNDHAGGARAVASAFPAAGRYSGESARMPVPMRPCLAGQAWQWDGVRFSVLNPRAGQAPESRNDRSCVLLVEGSHGRLLLTGDISSKSEPLVADVAAAAAPVVLLVPHHGSNSASSKGFIEALKPPFAVVSAGWRNRFRHPRPEVVARYREAGVPLLNTAELGAVPLEFPADAAARAGLGWRLREARYWRE
ncbi:MAG: DNA internalization-related competence protein ComEC/Rec2 [Rhodanobacter sp.]